MFYIRLVFSLVASFQVGGHVCGATTILDLTSLSIASFQAKLAMRIGLIHFCTLHPELEEPPCGASNTVQHGLGLHIVFAHFKVGRANVWSELDQVLS